MSPGSGPYEISTTQGTRVGRSLNETKDLGPKRVLADTDDPHPIWVVERLPNGKYFLYVRGAPTADVESSVRALLIQQEHKVEWELEELKPGLLRYLSSSREYCFNRGLEVLISIDHRIKDPKSGLFWTVPSYNKESTVSVSSFVDFLVKYLITCWILR